MTKFGGARLSADETGAASGRRRLQVFDAWFPTSSGPRLPQWRRRQHSSSSTPSNLQLRPGSLASGGSRKLASQLDG
uniref:Uncharacterized protein n=1 Tax=Oryza rufipogon TaxID=4529 RepID=A0A0E0Q6N4_ORYRU